MALNSHLRRRIYIVKVKNCMPWARGICVIRPGFLLLVRLSLPAHAARPPHPTAAAHSRTHLPQATLSSPPPPTRRRRACAWAHSMPVVLVALGVLGVAGIVTMAALAGVFTRAEEEATWAYVAGDMRRVGLMTLGGVLEMQATGSVRLLNASYQWLGRVFDITYFGLVAEFAKYLEGLQGTDGGACGWQRKEGRMGAGRYT